MKRCLVLFASIVGCSPHVETIVAAPVIIEDVIPPEPALGGLCPADMMTIDGDYCTDVQETCLVWVDAHGKTSKAAIPDDHDSGRCGVFKQPTVCRGAKVHKHFCIDKYEYPNVAGERPQTWMTWYDVKNACESKGKRLCEKSEWTFACEGPDMQPLPYGDGYHRDSTACNIDNPVPSSIKHLLKVSRRDSPEGKILDSLLIPAGSNPRCVSPFGVFDMVGNVDEFINNPAGHHWKSKNENHGKVDRGPFISGLVSGHVFGVRNACRPMTPGHNESFSWYETGGRCCDDPR